MQSLSTTFHNSYQHDNQNLGDYSRSLIRLYAKMESKAPSAKDSDALRQLKDHALRAQFVKGARETWVRRELRRIDMATEGKPFSKMRNEALLLFDDPGLTERRTRVSVRETQNEIAGDKMVSANAVVHRQEDIRLVNEVIELRKELQSFKSVGNEVKELKAMVTKLVEKKSRPAAETVCFICREIGHYARSCPNVEQIRHEGYKQRGNQRPNRGCQSKQWGRGTQGSHRGNYGYQGSEQIHQANLRDQGAYQVHQGVQEGYQVHVGPGSQNGYQGN